MPNNLDVDEDPLFTEKEMAALPEPPWPFIKYRFGSHRWPYSCRYCRHWPCSLDEIRGGTIIGDDDSRHPLHLVNCEYFFLKELKNAT